MRPQWLLLPVLALVAGCWDPVHADAVDALGPEAAGVPEGPTHRPGQPCTTCHGGDGPGEPDFVVAGTVYKTRNGTEPSVGTVVTITDKNGATRSLTTNSVGNFYLEKRAWSPVFPLSVVLDGDGVHKAMITTIGRDGGCASCHRGTGNQARMPAVFLRSQ